MACKEAPNAFMDRENEEPMMLRYPKPDEVDYEEVVKEKQDRVMQEVRQIDIEGDRRRTSMLVNNVLSPELYNGALADFLLTITTTMNEGVRLGENTGKVIKHEDGILCQVKNPYPGTVAKLTTSKDNGWFCGLLSTTRRSILKISEFNKDYATVMQKTFINFLNVHKKKAEVILSALKDYESTMASYNHNERRLVRAGKIVHDYYRKGFIVICSHNSLRSHVRTLLGHILI